MDLLKIGHPCSCRPSQGIVQGDKHRWAFPGDRGLRQVVVSSPPPMINPAAVVSGRLSSFATRPTFARLPDFVRAYAVEQNAGGGGGDGGGAETSDPKLQYLKNLMIKYLGTDEGEAREHMERAIATVLQFSEEVRLARGQARSTCRGLGSRRRVGVG